MHVGDVLEMPSQGIFGRVLSIGTRASVVRTWSGAEVVVPNSDLVSSAITNWTLSDRLCRVEVPVGVAYGTDPERVIALLLGAAGSLDRFLADPPPQVLFRGFGESSLDFLVRGWSDEGYEQMMSLTSDLTLAVHRTLAEAGITIPFPQRDLHLATVSPSARAALSGSGKGGEGER
jgi:small-conductance mechanosensitive channel